MKFYIPIQRRVAGLLFFVVKERAVTVDYFVRFKEKKINVYRVVSAVWKHLLQRLAVF